MERSLYPDNVEVRQRDLENTEDTKSSQIRTSRIDIISSGRAVGLTVTVNVATDTLIDVSAGRAYTPSGEVGELTSTQTGIPLSDYTDGTDNFVVLAYTELATTPAPNIFDGTTRNTEAVPVITIVALTAAEIAALPATAADLTVRAQDRIFTIATVNANGAGVPITSGDITQPEIFADLPTLDAIKLNRDGTNTVTGNITPDVADTRDFGSASLYWNQIHTNRVLFYRPAADNDSAIVDCDDYTGTNIALTGPRTPETGALLTVTSTSTAQPAAFFTRSTSAADGVLQVTSTAAVGPAIEATVPGGSPAILATAVTNAALSGENNGSSASLFARNSGTGAALDARAGSGNATINVNATAAGGTPSIQFGSIEAAADATLLSNTPNLGPGGTGLFQITVGTGLGRLFLGAAEVATTGSMSAASYSYSTTQTGQRIIAGTDFVEIGVTYTTDSTGQAGINIAQALFYAVTSYVPVGATITRCDVGADVPAALALTMRRYDAGSTTPTVVGADQTHGVWPGSFTTNATQRLILGCVAGGSPVFITNVTISFQTTSVTV